MAILIKTAKEIETMREGGKRHARILRELAALVHPGVSSQALEDEARVLIEREGGTAAFLNYKPYGAKTPFPAALCLSVNDEVVHGIPNGKMPKILKDGDIVSLDLGFTYKGLITDAAVTVAVGKIDAASKRLLSKTEEALYAGITSAKAGKKTGDVGFAIQVIGDKADFGIVDMLSGHGVGRHVHEDPYVPNFGTKGKGETLVAGMTIAIEPMFNLGTKDIVLDKDGYTYRTEDGARSAHFEHTILITEKGAEILTKE
jgi:methionyl aminopeptidase